MTPSTRADMPPDRWAARTLAMLCTMVLPFLVVASVHTSKVIVRGNWWLYPARDFAQPLFCISLTILVGFVGIQYWRYPRLPFGFSRSAYWLISASLFPLCLMSFALWAGVAGDVSAILGLLIVAFFPVGPTVISLIAYFSLGQAMNAECPAK